MTYVVYDSNFGYLKNQNDLDNEDSYTHNVEEATKYSYKVASGICQVYEMTSKMFAPKPDAPELMLEVKELNA